MLNFNQLTAIELINLDYETIAAQVLAPEQTNNLKYKMQFVFKELLQQKSWKYELHKDLDARCMATGEKVCLNLAFIIVIRQMLDITGAFDYSITTGVLDSELRQGLNEYLSCL